MRILGTTSTLINPPPPPRPRTISVLLDTIAEALNADGATVDPASIDTAGLSIVVDGRLFRLDLREETPDADTDDRSAAAEWQRMNRERFARFMGDRITIVDPHDAFIGDPAGIHGQEDPDDMPF